MRSRPYSPSWMGADERQVVLSLAGFFLGLLRHFSLTVSLVLQGRAGCRLPFQGFPGNFSLFPSQSMSSTWLSFRLQLTKSPPLATNAAQNTTSWCLLVFPPSLSQTAFLTYSFQTLDLSPSSLLIPGFPLLFHVWWAGLSSNIQ